MLAKVARKLESKADACRRRLGLALNIPLEYRYKDFSILLPADHMLPTYQRDHPKYDRFLPHLAKYIVAADTVIDIGANVGDTLAGMAEENSTLSYVCIEPDDAFFELLVQNISRIKRVKKGLNVRAVKSLVGKAVSGVNLEGRAGTRHAVISGEGKIRSQPLDELLADTPHSAIRILKTDVDGFDYDVLDSSLAVIRRDKPLIYFECQFDYDYQRAGYERTLSALEAEGYRDWTVFDNFGELVMRVRGTDPVIQLMNYVWRQNAGKSARTIHYYDVLAAPSGDAALVDRVLAEYY
jgi:FkbM family methyltransferase